MKLLPSASLIVLSASTAMASIPFGRGELVVSASVMGTYDSNLTGRRGAQDDYFGTFAPRVSYLRRAGKIEADAAVSVSVERYLDHTEFDSENLNATVSLHLSPTSFPNTTGLVSAAYTESYDVDVDVNERIKTATTTFSAETGLRTGPRTSVSFQAGYSNLSRVGASDQEMFNGGATFNYHEFLEDNTLSFIYGYTQAESSGENLRGVGLDQKSHSFSASLSRPLYRDVTGRIGYGYRILDRSQAETLVGVSRQTGTFFNAGIDGPFLPERLFPKIKSRMAISYEDARTPGVNDVGGKQIAGDLNLSWQARETTLVSVGATRAQRLSSTDLTVVSTGTRISVDQQLRINLSGNVGASYNWESYRGVVREDRILSFNTGLNYTFAHSWASSATYRYNSNSSNAFVSDFVRHQVTLSLAYTF
jgi:hypothetical protein